MHTAQIIMSRFFVSKENIKGNLAHIDGREAHHILNVMRLKEGDKVVVFDGTGSEYTGFIRKTTRRDLELEIVRIVTPKPEALPKITLAQSIPKKGRMDNIVEKATELGVHCIVPMLSERTIVSVENNPDSRISRWQRIAIETAKQCGRTEIPTVTKMRNFYDLIYEIDDFDLVIMAHLSEDTIRLEDAISDFKTGRIIVFIGPEGDFTPAEIEMAGHNKNCRFVTLGKRVLKSDTAGIFILSVLNYEFSS